MNIFKYIINQIKKRSGLVFISIFILGMIMTMNSGKWGIKKARNCMYTSSIYRAEDINIEEYKSLGMILSLFGGAGILIDYNKRDRE